MDPFARTDIVIIGGGFGGMNAAMALDLRLRRGLKIEVTLISRSNFFLFTPLLAEVAASLVESRHAVSPIRRMLSRVRFIEGTVQTVDPVRRTVGFVDQNEHSRLLSYQHCVLASGSVTEFFGIPGLAENALTLKTLGDAIRVRNRIIDLLERATLLSKEERRALLTFVAVGGGLNGTEIVGELHDFVLKALEDYPALDPGEIRMVLIEMGDRLAQELPSDVSAYAQRNLESRGVEVWLGARVTAYEFGRVRVHDGRELNAGTLIWTAGVRPSPLIRAVELSRPERADHRLPVNEYLQVRGYETLWAVGDCALIPDPSGGYQPPTAQHAVLREVADRVHARCESFLIVVHETGHRAASVRQLRWSDIDLEAKTVTWRADSDKIGFAHQTPLSEDAVAALALERRRRTMLNDTWVFPSDRDASKPLPRHTANKWWRRAEKLAEITHVAGTGYHSARRKFASEMKSTNLRDLAYMGGWKNPQTVLTVYQQPEMEVQRDALASRKKLRVAG